MSSNGRSALNVHVISDGNLAVGVFSYAVTFQLVFSIASSDDTPICLLMAPAVASRYLDPSFPFIFLGLRGSVYRPDKSGSINPIDSDLSGR